MKKKQKLPVKARMSRKQPLSSKPGRRVEDPKEAYTQEQLAEVGAITLIWNQVETMVDWLVIQATRPTILAWWDITSRLRGMEAKIEILHAVANRSQLLNDTTRVQMKLSLGAVLEFKRYRDRIVHSVPYDLDKGIVQKVGRQAELHQTLVTMPALNGLYQRLKLLLDELREVDLLFRLADEEGAMAVYRDQEGDPLERRRTRDVPIQTARLKDAQKVRLSLPLLPEFPDDEDTEDHSDFDETDQQ